MKNYIKRTVYLVVATTCVRCLAWTELGGGDHGGSNWVIASGTYIASNHFNIGEVTIATGATVYVQKYLNCQYGFVQIQASSIAITGILEASGAGYPGGNGGSGGVGASTDLGNGGNGSAGIVGTGPYGGVNGYAGTGGNNAWKDGTGGGRGGMGGYATNAALQGDTSTNEAVNMGSGGGGGGGGGAGYRGYTCSSGGGGGGAGNRGGGWIALHATNSIVVRGSVLAKGKAAEAGNGANGTNGNPGQGGAGGSATAVGQSYPGNGGPLVNEACWSGRNGDFGGAGAGGGILLKASFVDLRDALIDNRGGGNVVTNGGTIKVFYIDYQEGSLTNTGRTYLKQMMAPESGTVFEF